MQDTFSQTLLSIASQLDNPFDLAAFCYCYLTTKVPSQAAFIGAYIWINENSRQNNPNIGKLHQFCMVVKGILCEAHEAYTERQKDLVRNVLKMEDQLEPFGESEWNQCTLPFFILMAIDEYVNQTGNERTESGPLNQLYHDRIFVYTNTVNCMTDEVIDNTVILSASLRNELKHLIIIERKDIPAEIKSPPRIVKLALGKDDGERKRVLEGKVLKAAVIPFACRNMIEIIHDEGALFHIGYVPGHREWSVNRALTLLHKALEEKANIIIFPEFVCEKAVQEAIREELERLYWESPDKTAGLLLVIAGSRWDNGNNIADILGYDGTLLGRQYKYERYSDGKDEAGSLIENLKNPGKECTIVEIENLGSVMTGICRDIVAESYLARLTAIFKPQFLLVPAWSRSVYKGFKSQMESITAKNFRTCSILCNCCEAYEKEMPDKREIGLVVTPCKEKTIVKGKTEWILRDNCREDCECNPCIFIVNMRMEYLSEEADGDYITVTTEQKL